MAVRTTKVEIYGFSPERRDAWKQLAIDCQRMLNRLWQIWLCHHANNGSADKLRAHFDAFNKWKETKQGKKPEWPCKALEAPLTVSADPRSFYRILSAEFPNVSGRTRGLLTNAWQSRLNERKSATGSLKGWISILLANESLPSFTHPQPIPFDKLKKDGNGNAKLFKEGSDFFLELRIERLGDTGKSVVERCQLMLNKRKCASVRSIIEKCISGEYAWKGSNLVFDRGKWYAAISYDMPPKTHAEVSYDKKMVIAFGRKSPLRIRTRTGSFGFGGKGQHVEIARRRIEIERKQRQEHYRWAGSNQKGHGRKRAEAAWTKLSSRWKDFVKRCNNEMTRQIINRAISNGCGTVVLIVPDDKRKSNRLLSVAGSSEYSRSSWDYFQFESMLKAKCESEGLQFEVKKTKASVDRVRSVRKPNEPKRKKRTE